VGVGDLTGAAGVEHGADSDDRPGGRPGDVQQPRGADARDGGGDAHDEGGGLFAAEHGGCGVGWPLFDFLIQGMQTTT